MQATTCQPGPIAILLAAGPTDAEGRLRRMILSALRRTRRPMAWTELRSACGCDRLEELEKPIGGLIADGFLVRVMRRQLGDPTETSHATIDRDYFDLVA